MLSWLGTDGWMVGLLSDWAGDPVSAKALELFSVEPAGTETDILGSRDGPKSI